MQRLCIHVAALAALLSACGQKTSAAAPAHEAAIQVNGERATATELEAFGARASGGEPNRQQLADAWIRLQLLAQEATRRGLHRELSVKLALVNQLMAQFAVEPMQVDEGELQARWAEEKSAGERDLRDAEGRPMARLYWPQSLTVAALRFDSLERARAAAFWAKTAGLTQEKFLARAAAHSGPGSQGPPGDTPGERGTISEGLTESSKVFPPPVMKAAFALREPGDTAGPIAADGDYYVLRLVTRRKAATLEEQRPALQKKLADEKRAGAWEALIARLKREAKIEIAPAFLASAPSKETAAASTPKAEKP
jgi:hypothetical protein